MEHSDLLVILQNSLWSSDESGNNPAVVRECERQMTGLDVRPMVVNMLYHI